MWHKKLGHPAPLILKHVLHKLHLKSTSNPISFCDACKLGKLHQLPFQLSTHKAQAPLELLLSDVWGPAPMQSVEGYHYYIVFVDSYSRFTWLYPIKLKSDVLHIFLKFKVFVELQLNHKIKVLHLALSHTIRNPFSDLLCIYTSTKWHSRKKASSHC
ncbi:hypothetical protein ACOSQ3_004052 [Xanthoceras sorbifolium]